MSRVPWRPRLARGARAAILALIETSISVVVELDEAAGAAIPG